ncbi:CLUMA_CG011680, isoform A [Clunio marinus]|uniref:CLUMA_CG011680, isoform A n=1 Tax=Clunio marinus TaxID=568069 RepID=A0A1J1IH07_9DIPT|nr:CLUMA_CG011680, isoform A [Clunio marinus]
MDKQFCYRKSAETGNLKQRKHVVDIIGKNWEVLCSINSVNKLPSIADSKCGKENKKKEKTLTKRASLKKTPGQASDEKSAKCK